MKRGFTLIELLVMIAIIGLLSTLALLEVNRRGSAQEKKIDCSKYKFYSQMDLPAGCINYFNNKYLNTN